MKRNAWIVAAVLLLTLLPLWLAPRWVTPAADGTPPAMFGGADGKAQQAIGELAPDYQPWFQPLLEPASEEIASLLFALQAALGAGVIGYWLGCAVTRERLQKRPPAQDAASPAEKARRAD